MNWTTTTFTDSDLTEIYSKLNAEQHPPREQILGDYVNKTYEAVYEKARETMESWDIYSIHYLFWKFLTDNAEKIEETSILQSYKMTLGEFLKKLPKERLT
jgi:hypothetical protein